jgi:hypothetical protein
MIENQGNLITRRAFTDEFKLHADRLRELHLLTHKSGSVCYRYTEEVGLYGSGLPSPLHVVIESVRRLYELDTEEGCEISFAQEFADAPAIFLRRLRGEIVGGLDAIGKINFLLKNVTDANFLLKGRDLFELALGELKEFRRLMMNAASLAREIQTMADARIEVLENSYPGAPFQRERALREAGGESRSNR